MAEENAPRTRMMLAENIRQRGYKYVTPLKCAGHAHIFKVQETQGADAYVAKVVALTGLDAKGRASATQEVSLLKGLAAHHNLIAYRESFMGEAHMLYIVMSLAEDGDLRRVVTDMQAAKRLLPEPVVLSWFRQTLDGLAFLHGQGVVHRDLKSSNIFLCEARRRIRIGDFGISRVLESTSFATSVVGTPAYMSPELMRNERYDYHVDMWALGCIMFELCTLSLPWRAVSLVDLATQVMEKEPEWQLWMDKDFSDELRDVIHRLLLKEVASRPTSGALLQEGLFVAPTGRAAQPVPEEAWIGLTPAVPGQQVSPDRQFSQTQLSDATTHASSNMNASSEDALSSRARWTSTPSMEWEAPSRSVLYDDSIEGVRTGSTIQAQLPPELVTTSFDMLQIKQMQAAAAGVRGGAPSMAMAREERTATDVSVM
jgi:NIMA (never in mitosis gene a)-related kinase